MAAHGVEILVSLRTESTVTDANYTIDSLSDCRRSIGWNSYPSMGVGGVIREALQIS